MNRRGFKRWGLGLLFLVALPLGLYVVINEQVSWRPRTFTVGGPIQELLFSPDGRSLAVGRWRYVTLWKKQTSSGEESSWNNCGQFEVWNVRSRIPSQVWAHPDADPVVRLVTSPNKSEFIYVNRVGDVKRFDTTTGRCRRIARAVVDEYGGFSVSPDGQEFVVTSRSGIRFYDAQSGKLKRTWSNRTSESVASLAYSPDGKLLYTTTDEEGATLALVNAQTGKTIGRINSGGITLEIGGFSPDGKLLAVYNGYGVLLYDVPSCKVAKKLYQGDAAIRVMVWSPDSTLLAVGDMNGRLNLWSPAQGKILRFWQGNTNYPIGTVAFSPDSRIMASAATYPDKITLRRVK